MTNVADKMKLKTEVFNRQVFIVENIFLKKVLFLNKNTYFSAEFYNFH